MGSAILDAPKTRMSCCGINTLYDFSNRSPVVDFTSHEPRPVMSCSVDDIKPKSRSSSNKALGERVRATLDISAVVSQGHSLLEVRHVLDIIRQRCSIVVLPIISILGHQDREDDVLYKVQRLLGKDGLRVPTHKPAIEVYFWRTAARLC